MIIGGCCEPSNVVELVTVDPEYPVPECLKNFYNFPTAIYAPAAAFLGTTLSKKP
jgi:hypothetical protein